MLRLFLAGLLLAPSPVTSLDVDVPDPPSVRAGEEVKLPVDVSLEGPFGPMPGLAGPVELELEAPGGTRCELADERVTLDPVAGRAQTELTCRPRDPGAQNLTVTARSPPHSPGSWIGDLPVQPDRLTGDLSLGDPDGYEIPYSAELAPEHLDEAEVEARWIGDLDGSPLAFRLDPRPWTAAPGHEHRGRIEARHGPGTYDLALDVDGPRVEAFQATGTVHVPEPPSGDTLALNVTVQPGQPSVSLTSDSVNDDGKNKRPGDQLITRFTAEHTDEVRLEVTRRVAGDQVPLGVENVSVGADGDGEHRFSHSTLPAGLVTVTASAGDSSAARTAQIRDVGTEARLSGPETVLADGRPVRFDLELSDPNFGSTPLDPGPVFELPDVRWTVLDWSVPVEGWNVSIGPFEGGPEGMASTSRIPWPNGTSWANATDGAARMPMTVQPPPDVEPDDYRISLYDPDGDRIGGASIELLPAPELTLEADRPRPGQSWPIRLDVPNPTDRFSANLSLSVEGRPVANRSLDGGGNTSLPLPQGLPAGTSVSVEARGWWPGRPPVDGPDSRVVTEIPSLAPTVSVDPTLDGSPTPPPLAVHPASAHEVGLRPTAIDPNGDPVEVSTTVTGPEGTEVDWTGSEPGELAIPRDAPPGRYRAEVQASSPDGTVDASVPIDVGSITRLRLAGPDEIQLREGEAMEAPLTVRNAGTAKVETLVLAARNETPLNLTVGSGDDRVELGAPIQVDLAAGAETVLPLHVRAQTGATGPHPLRLTVAGGPP